MHVTTIRLGALTGAIHEASGTSTKTRPVAHIGSSAKLPVNSSRDDPSAVTTYCTRVRCVRRRVATDSAGRRDMMTPV